MRKNVFKGFLAIAALSLSLSLPLPSQAKAPPKDPPKELHWVETFQSSPAAYGVNAPAQWSKDMAGRITTASGTLRFQFPVSVGGKEIRIRLSNETGTRPLKISAATIALATGFDGTASGAVAPVTFGGVAGANLPAGAPMLSDPVAFPVKAGDQILVSATVPDGVDLDSYGATGMWVAAGDQANATTMTDAKMLIGRPIVSGVSVLADQPVPIVVTLGDSITAGGRKTPEELHGWPEALSQRLNAESKTNIAVINAGIAGNRILSDGYGQAMLARLDRDVLRIEGVTYLIVLAGINDIGFPGRQQFGITQPDIQLADLINGYRQIITRAHTRGMKVIGGTLLPFEGAFYCTPAKEEMRQYVNDWIRISGAFDAVIDFDVLMRDPANPLKLKPEFDSGDHLHPNLAGQKAMGEAIDLKPLK